MIYVSLVRTRVQLKSALTWDFEALLIVKNIDDALPRDDWNRRPDKHGRIVVQLDVVRRLFSEDCPRPFGSVEWVESICAISAIPARESSHEQLVHHTAACNIEIRGSLLEA